MPWLRRWRWPLLFVAVWAVFGLLLSVQFFAQSSYRSDPEPWSVALTEGFLDMSLWAAMALAAFITTRLLSPGRFSLTALVGLHLLIGPAVVLARTVADLWILRAIGWQSPNATLLDRVLLTFTLRLMTYFAFVGAGYGFEYLRRYHERQLNAARLREELVRAQLSMLQMQLRPHFLFNTLHAISTLMQRDVRLADRVLVRLADLLRHSLRAHETMVVRLKEEVELLGIYLDIERVRFGPRLTVSIDIDGAEGAMVPHMILQPLVENAIRHGISPMEGPGRLRIAAHRDGDRVRISVADNGAGISDGDRRGAGGHGVGLANTRSRLQHLYGDDHVFELRSRREGGLEVVLDLPYSIDAEGRLSSAAARV
jgi:signal transduction histidine kinase